MKRKTISLILLAAAAALGIYSMFALPAVVKVQIGLAGQTANTMPKFLAVIIPVGLTVIGSVMELTSKEEKNIKGLIVSIAGVAVLVLSLIFNS